MAAVVHARSSAGWFCYALVALLGIFLFVDTVLLLGFFLISALTGAALNPYIGIVLFLILPALGAAGAGLCRWGYRHMSLDVPKDDYEVQGR